jgi:hypothetical protein
MAFNGTEGGQIPLATGAAMTAEYRAQNPGEIKAHFYGKEILDVLLNQEDCVGIRIYYGIDENGNKELVLVGTDASECDLTDLIVDLSNPCPNRCSKANALNS